LLHAQLHHTIEKKEWKEKGKKEESLLQRAGI
jgi:hypothetical protein